MRRSVQIPIASVEEWDLVSIDVDGHFSMELRAHGEPFMNRGRWWLEAWGTIQTMAAVTSATGVVDLLQRRKIGRQYAGGEPLRHPHGWAFIYAGQDVMHYCVDTTSLCTKVVGYTGLCYPVFDASYFAEGVYRCPGCLEAVDADERVTTA